MEVRYCKDVDTTRVEKLRLFVRNHKAFEGFKTKPVEFVRNVKMFGTNAMNEVAGGIRALQHQLNHRLVPR